jgi:hypothetical protein
MEATPSLINMTSETPSGFLIHAKEFFEAAQLILSRRDSVSLPSYFLLGRSIELALKAFLLSRGLEAKELKSRKFGHDLDALLDKALALGIEDELSITELEEGALRLLNYDYLDKRLEYRITNRTYALPFIDITTQIAQKLAYEMQI